MLRFHNFMITHFSCKCNSRNMSTNTCACMLLFSVLSICSVLPSTSLSCAVLSGSVIKLGFSCSIHIRYTLITFLVADASQDGNRKALGEKNTIVVFVMMLHNCVSWKDLCNTRPVEGNTIPLLPGKLTRHNVIRLRPFYKYKYLTRDKYLVEDLVDKIHIVPGG